MKDFFVSLTRNPISLIGSAIALAAAVLIVSLLVFDWLGAHGNPYVGVMAFVVVPVFLVIGMLLIPFGIVRYRRLEARRAGRREKDEAFPVIDLNTPRMRRSALLVIVIGMFAVVVLGAATYKGVEVMDSTEFCGSTCHSVMHPEFTAYHGSPHARVKCVECHIGPGADWFVKSKLSGAWQVVAVAFDLYPRPIPTPIHNLRPARETCEQCHWPTKFVGDRLRVITHYDEDEENTELKTVLLLRVGGVEGRKSQGIHWHVDPEIQVRYRSDEKRETIHDVELRLPDGTVKLFYPGGKPSEEAAANGKVGEWRLMDCVDCHNRPTHVYRQPSKALDHAIAEGRIDRTLPYVRREALSALQESYGSHEEARQRLLERMESYYRENYPEVAASRAAEIRTAGEVLGEIYSRNVFPAMKVGWSTYPDHIGHESFPGCFRCHNDDHETEDGEVISQDCDTCHTLLALEEKQPEILEMLRP